MFILENKYDRLFKEPLLEDGELIITEENIARQIVELGLLRISDDAMCNFVILPLLAGKKSISFSKTEIENAELLKISESKIRNNLTVSEREKAEHSISEKINYIRSQFRKFIPVSDELEIKIARIIAQSAHPSVLLNIIELRVKIFISFAYSISDLLDIQSWIQNKGNSGMQASSHNEINIYISTTGNPFNMAKNEESSTDDEFNAISRMMVVAAQEIGHFADIKLSSSIYERFSINKYYHATEECSMARNTDMNRVNIIRSKFIKAGLPKLFELERKIEVQKKYRKFSFSLLMLYMWKDIYKLIFRANCNFRKVYIHNLIKAQNKLGHELVECISDYAFNLAPIADVYRNQDKRIENGIACAEALARVPQQKVKWGDNITRIMMKELYNIYYKKVIPEEISFYEKISGKKFFIDNRKTYVPLYKKIMKYLEKKAI